MMDSGAQACIAQALEFAVPGQRIMWQDEAGSGIEYAVVPGPSDAIAGVHCRRFELQVFVNRRHDSATGSACRRPDGSWAAGLPSTLVGARSGSDDLRERVLLR